LFNTLLIISTISTAQATDAVPTNTAVMLKPLNIPHNNGDITLDGELNETLWSDALTVELDIVNSPWDNLPSPVKTTAKLIENGKFLYVAFIAYDPEPSKIQGFLGERDTKWFDDVVGIKLDTNNNRRQNYEFFVNPYGVQNDATFNEITAAANTLWDGHWFAYGKITEQGYQVEMAIPYNILNFKENNEKKKWAIELIRIYPRDTTLRISHVPLNRDNPCWLCQYPEAIGFENAEIGHNVRLTPTLTASRDEKRDIYDVSDDWHSENDIEAGLDLRWGINTNNLLNATLNPDFSAVESDSGQLSINTTFSLFYDEKRAFFLDNADYFSSDYNLVYTRNIADPDYGGKLTGRTDQHSYGFFVTNDTETNFLVPGNLGSEIASLNEESHSTALRYRYDYDEDISIGAISTIRTANDYHNYLAGLDGQYRLTESDTFRAQLLSSDTQYPDDLFENFCLKDDCRPSKNTDCTFGNCGFTEQVHRTQAANINQSSFSDQAYKLDYKHSSEFWQVNLNHQNIGSGFRADLGFMPQADIKKNTALVDRLFYGDQDSFWQQARLSGQWQIKHNQDDELIERSLTTSFNIDGPMQSTFDLMLTHGEKVGLRHDESNLAIDGNTTRFDENQATLSGTIKPTNRTYLSLEVTAGDKIDYRNDRLGDLIEVAANITVNITDHLEFDFYQTYSKLDANNEHGIEDNVYIAKLSELRLSYQFDVYSYLKLNLVYSDVNRNPDNNPFVNVSKTNKSLSSQLIYAYKLTPQTVFFLGYSDSSFQDDDINDLSREERTFFTKISYAWAP
ncbi:MAG: carbohydrate binding family 9 domain-containing protein, partial [Colwellia sp.]|nr:carbohydrate binding family 9 domain-containing protein [Colwellia sp.]